MKICIKMALIFALGMLQLASVAFAQEIEMHGFAQANYSLRVADSEDAPESMSARDKDIILGDERLQLEFSGFSSASDASFSARVDLLRDALDSEMKLDLREAYLDLSFWKFDTRIGRQIITWGLGDLVFINDTFPKDWVAFLSGRPLQYLKIGSDALNVSFHPGFISAQLLLVPFYQPDNLPSGERLFFYDPLPILRSVNRPQSQFENFEIAGRLYRTLWRFDVSLYAYRGFSGMPAVQNMSPDAAQATLFYPELRVYGASSQGAMLDGLLSLEAGYYDFVDDREGDNPFVENPQVRFLTGYQRAFGADLTLGTQYYAEAMLKHSEYRKTLPAGFSKQERVRHSITLRVTQFFKYQTVRLSLFAWISPNDEDYFLSPEIRYSFSDELWGALGGNVFGGTKEHTFLGQFEHNDNIYLTMRYGF